MFIILLSYKQSLSVVDTFLAGHNAYLQKYYKSGTFICSGPQVPREGGVILCSAGTVDEVHHIVSEDPFVSNGVAEYSILEFRVADYLPGFEKFLLPAAGNKTV
ncbi:MAG: YciI family protein [Ignavibacteriales bacterium]|nr:YciI family protein [Ignavibacteriales bacterium]